jgi:hypothetical protein
MNSSRLFLLLLLVISFVPLSFAQTSEKHLEVFEPVPLNERIPLAKRLKIFLEYRRTEQWGLLFDMLPKIHTQYPEVAEITKVEFLAQIKKYGKTRIINFIPESTEHNITIDGQYIIWGCAEAREGLGEKKWLASIFASLENGKWHFSDISFAIQLDAREPLPCSSKKGK